MSLFAARFDPAAAVDAGAAAREEVEAAFATVDNLNEDRVPRAVLAVIRWALTAPYCA